MQIERQLEDRPSIYGRPSQSNRSQWIRDAKKKTGAMKLSEINTRKRVGNYRKTGNGASHEVFQD
jgi:hypothetical protein